MAPRRLLLLTLFAVGCGKAPQTNDAIRTAIVEHLSKRTDMLSSTMNVQIVSVNFREAEADAVASIEPKEGGGGIRMTYTLAVENGKWAVKKSAAPQGNPHGGPTPSGGLPAGHPPLTK